MHVFDENGSRSGSGVNGEIDDIGTSVIAKSIFNISGSAQSQYNEIYKIEILLNYL